MLNIGNDEQSWKNYQCIGPNEETTNGEAILNFIDESDYKSLNTYTIDFWFKKDNDMISQRLLEITDNIKTISIIVYNNAISLNLIENTDEEIDEISYINKDMINQRTFNLKNSWCHFAFGFDKDTQTIILHLNGKKIYAGSELSELALEEMHLYSHTIDNPIYFALIKINKKIKFQDDIFDLNLVNKPIKNDVEETTENDIEENEESKDISKKTTKKFLRYFNGKINENTAIYQSFKENDGNQVKYPLKNIFTVLPSSGTKLYPNDYVVNNDYWKNNTGCIGPLSNSAIGSLRYKHIDENLELYDWTIDFWFKRTHLSNKLVPLISIINNANTTYTELYTKNDKILLKTYDKDMSIENRQSRYYSIELKNNIIKAIEYDINNDNKDENYILGEIQSSKLIYNLNDWNHIAFIYEEDYELLQIFLNGILIFSLEEYMDYVLDYISLNTNIKTEDATYFSCFRLSSDIEFENNFDIEEFKKFPYDLYAFSTPIYRGVIDDVEGTLEEILNQYPKTTDLIYNTGELPVTELDNYAKSHDLLDDTTGRYSPKENSTDDDVITLDGEELRVNSDIQLMNYYPDKGDNSYELKDDGTTDTVTLADLPFTKSVPDLLWNAITANPGVTSPYNVTTIAAEKYDDRIYVPELGYVFNNYYSLGPSVLNDVNPGILTLSTSQYINPIWTCEFWFKRSMFTTSKPTDFFEIFDYYKNRAIKISLENDKLIYYVNNDSKVYYKESCRANLNDLIDSWNHFSITYYNKNSTATVFINGQPVYTSSSVTQLIPSNIKIYLQHSSYNSTFITGFKFNSGLKYAKAFSIKTIVIPIKTYINIVNIPRKTHVFAVPELNPTIKKWIFNGKVNDKTALYFPIQGSNKEYEKESPIDYNTGLYKYDDPYLVEGTSSKNYTDIFVNNDADWKGFNPIGPLNDSNNGNIHVTNNAGHKSPSGKYTVSFWMYRKTN